MSVEDQFEGDERALLRRIQELLDVRMKDKRKRYVHSLGVAETALHLAEVYGVDRFDAAAAGLIHDWDKVLSDDELVTRALHYGIKIAGSPSAATPLLHGPVAAYELPQLFPELSPAVFQAVDRHTVGACDMTPLDLVVFVADAIEPNRHGDYAHALRKMVGESTLDELFFSCFAQGLVYVIQSGRYLYPTAISIYNHYASLSASGVAAEDVARAAAQAAYDKKGEDVQVLDLTELSDVCDYFVLATGTNNRQVDSIVDEIEEKVAEACGEHPFSIEGREQKTWMLMDYGSVVVHVFTPEARDFYRLEKLWGAAPQLPLNLL